MFGNSHFARLDRFLSNRLSFQLDFALSPAGVQRANVGALMIRIGFLKEGPLKGSKWVSIRVE